MRREYGVDERGVTLLELMLMLVTVSIVVAAIPLAFRSGTDIWDKGDSHAETMQNGLIAIEDISRELRQARSLMGISDPTSDTGYIQFKYRDYKDENGNGQTNDYKYQRYELSDIGGTVTHNTVYDSKDADPTLSTGSEMAGPAEGLRFVGYNASGSPTAELDDIRSVRIYLTNSDSKEKVNDIPLSAQVHLRDFPNPGAAEDFAVFGHVSVDIKENTDIGNEIPSNVGSNGSVSMGNNTYINGRLVTFTPDLKDGVTYGPDYELPPPYIIEMPCSRSFGAYTLGGENLTTAPNTVIPDDVFPPESPYNDGGYLAPFESGGICYGDFDLSNDNQLYLKSGTYFFNSFTAQQDLTLHVNLAEGPIDAASNQPYVWIFVDGQVKIGNMLGGLYLAPDGVADCKDAAKHIYMEIHHEQTNWGPGGFKSDAGCLFGRNVTFCGTVYAPYANISISDGTFYGSLYTGGSIVVDGGTDPSTGENTKINFVKSYYAEYYWTYPSDYDDEICPPVQIHANPPPEPPT